MTPTITIGNYSVGQSQDVMFISADGSGNISADGSGNISADFMEYADACDYCAFALHGFSSLPTDRVPEWQASVPSDDDGNALDKDGNAFNEAEQTGGITITARFSHSWLATPLTIQTSGHGAIVSGAGVIKAQVEWISTISGKDAIVYKTVIEPTESPTRFVVKPNWTSSESAELVDKINIRIIKINMPNNKIRINSIICGEVIVLDSRLIKSCSITDVWTPVADSLPIDTATITTLEQFSTNAIATATIAYDGEVRRYYAGKIAVANKQSSITLNGAAQILQSTDRTFFGVSDSTAVEHVFGGANVSDVDIVIPDAVINSEYFKSIAELSGYDDTKNQSEVLSRLLVSTALTYRFDRETPKMYVELLERPVRARITAEYISDGGVQKTEPDVQSVEITAYNYTTSESESIAKVGEDGETNEVKEITQSLSVPIKYVGKLACTNGTLSVGKSTHKKVVFTPNRKGKCEVFGNKWERNEITKKFNFKSTVETAVQKINQCGFINEKNIDKVGKMCYNYYTANRYSMDIFAKSGMRYGASRYGKARYGLNCPIKAGDLVEFEYPQGSKNMHRGYIISQTINATGGMMIKKHIEIIEEQTYGT